MASYKDSRREFKSNLEETRVWEQTVLKELRSREQGMAKAERTEFANVLVCKALEKEGAPGTGGGGKSSRRGRRKAEEE